MKITPLIIGAINAQSGDDADRWDAADFTFNSDVFNYSDDGGKWAADGSALSVAAVTCWESNNMGDLNHYVTQSDDGYGWENIHHGHGPDQAGSVYQTGSYYENSDAAQHAGTNTLDMHSVLAYDNRLSGCIYEASSWAYSADTYDHTFKVEYGLTDAAVNAATGNDASGATTVRPVWWHYFNAHVVPGHVAGTTTYNSHARHLIVMANPSYEGLGYLNFIVTYGAFVDGDDRWDSNENANTRGLNTDVYSSGDAFKIVQGEDNSAGDNDNLGQWYSSYNPDDKTWDANMPAISSFPHNDLGKDFRFNVRILHHGGNGDPDSDCGDINRDGPDCKDSYYWYKVDEIKMTFPHTVRCPREAKNLANGTAGYGDMRDGGEAYESAADTFRCMDSANFNGHRGWNSETAKNNRNSNWSDTDAREDIDKPWFLENLGSAHGLTGAAYAGVDVDGTNTDTSDGFICGGTPLADGEWYKCGTHYTVKGLMNTYDEFAQQEFGTMQEFWFQFHYHFVLAYNGDHRDAETLADPNQTPVLTATTIVDVSAAPGYGNGDTATANSEYDHRHNFPNTLFNSFEITSVAFNCNAATRDTRLNTNAC